MLGRQTSPGVERLGNRMERQERKNSGDGKPAKAKFDWKLLPDVLALIKPRRGILVAGFGLMVINRVSGLVLPASTKYFLDDVILKRQARLLPVIVLVVVTATIIQGLTSYALTQLLSKSSWRMISELREKVQAHIGRLPVSFYDANKTGVLISRIMSDVEGVRNLIGTGLVEFAGGILTAVFALVYLLRTSVSMTAVAFVVLLIFGVTLNRAFKTIRPIFRARPKINAEVTGRLTESIGGVRVVKGYHAEAREEKVFGEGVQRLLDNVLQTLTATSLMSLSATSLMGIVSAMIMFLGARQILAGTMTPGTFFSYTLFLGFLIAPVAQIVAIGPQITEALAGLERTREVLNENPEDEDPNRRELLERIRGEVIFEDVSFSYDTGKEVLHEISFNSQPGTVTALVGPSGAGKSTVIGLIAAFYVPIQRPRAGGRRGSGESAPGFLSHSVGRGVAGNFSFRRLDSRERRLLRGRTPREDEILAACRIARVDEFAESFETKYDTVVGERGVKLSGGQRQRVSIARAILADPRILILDEATSSLDSESEAFIQEGLRYLMRGRTTFVIAHRLSTVRRADQILVLEAGRIIERGTHATLYAARGRYFDLYTKQHGLESNLFLAPGEGGDDSTGAQDANGVAAGRGAGGGVTAEAAALPEAIRLIRGGSGS